MSIRVITPDTPKENYSVKEKMIFLAGPIQGTKNWQENAIKWLELSYKGEDELIIANPRRETPIGFKYEDQVDWESFHLNYSDVILFWLAEETKHFCDRAYAQTTRFELGEWFDSEKVVIGANLSFPGLKYIKYKIEEFNKSYLQPLPGYIDSKMIPYSNSLLRTCCDALEMLTNR